MLTPAVQCIRRCSHHGYSNLEAACIGAAARATCSLQSPADSRGVLHQPPRNRNRLFSVAADLTGAMSEPGEAETPVAEDHISHNALLDRNKPAHNRTVPDTSRCPVHIAVGGGWSSRRWVALKAPVAMCNQ